MAVATPPAEAEPEQFSVVIPHYNDAASLARTLASLRASPSNANVETIVVDDHSAKPLSLLDPSVSVIRLPHNQGPAAARNVGAAAASSAFVAFVDSGVEVTSEQLATLVTYFDDPATACVAPRIIAAAGDTTIARYEKERSPLDMGDRSSTVKPNTTLAYVPSTCLVVRKSTFADEGGFDEQLRFGEDVDLVWRLQSESVVRFVSAIEATHPPRGNLKAFVKQRAGYGSSAANLAIKHPQFTTPLIIDKWGAATIASVLLGQPIIGFGIAAYRAHLLSQSLPNEIEGRSSLAATIIMRGQVAGARGLVESLTRPYAPLAIAGALLAPHRVLPFVVASAGLRAKGLWKSPAFVGLSVVDDLAYSTGVWQNVIRHRSARCLIPRIM